MKNLLYLVRHGENPANISKEFSSNIVDYSLTPKGVLQSRQTAEWFKEQGWSRRQWADSVYCSPLRRAVETAEIIAGKLNLGVCLVESFREIDVGDLEKGPGSMADWTYYQQVVGDWFDGNHHIRLPGGENYLDLWQRMRQGLLEATDEISGKRIIVVGHGGIMSLTLKDLCPDIDVEWLRDTMWDNCAITEIDLERTGEQLYGRLIAWNRHSHLSGEAAELVPGLPEEI